MDNEFENVRVKGFSRRAQNPEFIEEVRGQVKKNFKYAMIAAPAIYIVIVAIMALICKKQGTDIGTVFFTAAFLLLIFIGIVIGFTISFFKDLSDLKKDGVDGTVLKKRKWRTRSTEKKAGKTRCYIIICPDEGKKIKIKDRKALAYYSYIEEGDKVRFHPGYPFPIEIYDKAKSNANVCVFCGSKNEPSSDTCQNCKKTMLI